MRKLRVGSKAGSKAWLVRPGRPLGCNKNFDLAGSAVAGLFSRTSVHTLIREGDRAGDDRHGMGHGEHAMLKHATYTCSLLQQTYNLCSAIVAYSDHSFFPVCGSFHFKPVFVCIFTVHTDENWLENERNHIQGIRKSLNMLLLRSTNSMSAWEGR